MQEVTLIARIVIGALFLTSAVAKMRRSSTLVQAFQQYGLGLVGPKLARVGARLLPAVEFILGLLLVTGIWLKATSLVATGLLLAFTMSMTVNIARGHRFPCNCFGTTSSDIGFGTLSRNVILVIAGLLVAIVSPWPQSRIALLYALSGADIVALFIVGGSLYVILLFAGEIDTLVRISKAK